MLRTGRLRGMAAVLAIALGLLVAGCGSTALLPGHAHRSCAGPTDQDGPAAPRAEIEVVCRWSAALRAGDVDAAAAYFRLPSVFEDGPGGTLAIRTRRQAVLANEALTCGAAVISAFREGPYINVLFRLTVRSGPDGGARACGATPGDSARTAFLIRGGRIAAWLRTASRPGDPGTQSSPSQSQTQTNQAGGSPI